MIHRFLAFGGVFWMLAALVACQPSGSNTLQGTTETDSAAAATTEIAAAPNGPNWHQAEDCRGKLVLLQQGLIDGRIVDLDDTPFVLLEQDAASADAEWLPSALPSLSSETVPDTRCVIRVGRAIDRQSDHRLLDQERVRSRYQSGTKREKNPAYEVAKVRLRHAEKASKPGKSSIIKVGDPLVDLVGTVLGGALTGLGQWGAGDQLEEALDTLMATPRSIEHPIYKSYEFERARVRASREATIPVTLTDRMLQESWQTSLKHREVRELKVITGLDRQDEDYARHRQESLTKDGLRIWLAETPTLPLVDMASGLLSKPSVIPLDRLALVDPAMEPGENDLSGDKFAFDAAVLPERLMIDVGHQEPGNTQKNDGLLTSRIKLIGETVEAEGVFVAPHLILTSSPVVGDRSLIDVQAATGQNVLGLVAAVDHALGLALVQSPSKGRPVAIGNHAGRDERMPGIGRSSTIIHQASMPKAAEPAISTPRVVAGQVIGFDMPGSADITGEAIRIFFERQQHLLPAGSSMAASAVSRP